MKLKTLLNTIDCDCVIYHGHYGRDASPDYVGECHSYDKAGIFGRGDNSAERYEAENRIRELYDRNVNKVYISTRGVLVIYVK